MKKPVILLLFLTVLWSCQKSQENITIIWYGHSCFEIKYAGTRIVVDPFTPEWFDYILPEGKIDYGFVSHDAPDHNSFSELDCNRVYWAGGHNGTFNLNKNSETKKVSGKIAERIGNASFSFWTVPSFHDDRKGDRDGVNGILCFELDKLKIVHLGDIGHVLEQKHIKAIGPVDILMIPIDGYYTIDAEYAFEIVNQLNPNIVIPMHYKTDKVKREVPEPDLNNFKDKFNEVEHSDQSHILINKKDLKDGRKLLLLKYF